MDNCENVCKKNSPIYFDCPQVSCINLSWLAKPVTNETIVQRIVINKEIKKTALGAEDTVEWQHFANAGEAITDLKSKGYNVYAVEQAAGSWSLEKISFAGDEKIAVVFGNEVSGVEQDTIQLCDGCIEIPQIGMKHSLNIATAAGVVLWEIVRTRIKAI